jgi:peptidoglycan hydrolase CwlO-like protein
VLPASVQGAYAAGAAPGTLGAGACAAVLARMPPADLRLRAVRLASVLLVTALLLGSALTASSAGDLQGQIDAGKSAAAGLRSKIATETSRLHTTSHGLADASRRLASVQRELTAREAELRRVQTALIQARDHLVDLENRLQRATGALAANLVMNYEQGRPDLVTVILESHGFTDLLEQVNFLHRIGTRDAQVVSATRSARAAVSRQASLLTTLERRDRALTVQVLAQRNDVASLQAALLRQQISDLRARSGYASRLQSVAGRVKSLEARVAAIHARAAAAAARAAVTGNANVGGIAVNTGGIVQAPAGAPAAVAQVTAAGNAIATLPYVYGGGHASFHANGYDCSGSVSYALAAAGLVTSPLDSTGFQSWGDPGPGRWITVYANAGHAWMEVAGWRFDTVALSESATRWSRGGGEYSGYVVRHPPAL